MPASDQQRKQLRHICEQIREALESSQTLGGNSAELAEIEATLASLNEQMTVLRDRKMLEFYNTDFDEDFRNILPCSPLSGYFNPIAPNLKIWCESEFVYAEGYLGRIHEGPPESVHGGVISGIYDQVLAFTALAHQLPSMTASLTIKYHRPTPLFKLIRFTTWLEHQKGRHITIHGECHSDGILLTSAEGLFIQYKNNAAHNIKERLTHD